LIEYVNAEDSTDKSGKKEEEVKKEEKSGSTEDNNNESFEQLKVLNEDLKKDQDDSMKDVKNINERVSEFLRLELLELETRLEGKMRNLREEFKKHSKLTLSLK